MMMIEPKRIAIVIDGKDRDHNDNISNHKLIILVVGSNVKLVSSDYQYER